MSQWANLTQKKEEANLVYRGARVKSIIYILEDGNSYP